MHFRPVFYPAFAALTCGAASGQDALKYRFQFYDEVDYRCNAVTVQVSRQFEQKKATVTAGGVGIQE